MTQKNGMHINQIDLHYHAGMERTPEVSLEEYLAYASKTGRRILGLTDHINFYLTDRKPDRETPYEYSVEGLLQYWKDVEALKDRFSNMKILFAPEIGPKIKFDTVPSEVIAISDYFICEIPGVQLDKTLEENTKAIIDRVQEISEFSQSVTRPVFIAHPFRGSVNLRLVKRVIEPWVTQMQPRERWQDFTVAELNSFFMFDIEKLAVTACKLAIPLELNGSTHKRILFSNLYTPYQMYLAAYETFLNLGVDIVPGSDQHHFRAKVGNMGGYVAMESFRTLGIGVADVRFLDHFR